MMNDHTSNENSLPFRPVSLTDFKRYAKNLSWLIEVSIQTTHNLLAEIYGFANYHQLKKTLDSDPQAEPGLFDAQIKHSSITQYPNKAGIVDMLAISHRSNRILEILSKYRGGQRYEKLTKRDWQAKEIGLFEEPEVHRYLFQKEKQKYLVLAGAETQGPLLNVTDYAQIDLRDDDYGECFLAFTTEGKAIFDAVDTLLPDRHTMTNEDLKNAEAAID